MRTSPVIAVCLALVLAFGLTVGVLVAAEAAPPVLAERLAVTPVAPPASGGAQPARPDGGQPPFYDQTRGGAPAFVGEGAPAADGLLMAVLPPVPGSANLAVCLDTDRVWGVKTAGQLVTVTVNGTQMGAALADSKGFFWAPLYKPTGDRAGLKNGDAVIFYPSGASSVSLTLRGISGQINPVTNVVSGTIAGVSASTSVTVYVASVEPTLVAYSKTVTSNASGYFTADFTGVYDLLSNDSAMVAYALNGVEVHRHVYPAKNFFVGPTWQEAGGYAAPGSAVTVTQYLADGVTPVQTINITAEVSGGWFYAAFDQPLDVDDVVEVTRADGVTLRRTVDVLTEVVDAANDRVTGQATPGATVVGVASQLTAQGSQNVHLVGTVSAGGLYTLSFSGLVDIRPGDWAGVFVPDAGGNDINIWQPVLGAITVNQTWGSVSGRGAVAPPVADDEPVTLTIHSAALGTDFTDSQNLDKWGGFSFDQNLPALEPGDVVAVSDVGSVTISPMSVSADPALDRLTGSIVLPTAQMEASAWQWNSVPYPLGGTLPVSLTASASGRYTATLPGFDFHNGTSFDVSQRTPAGFLDQISGDADHVHLYVTYHGLGGVLYPPGVAYTITFSNASGVLKAQRIGLTDRPIGDIGWHEFYWNGGQRMQTGDRVRVQGGNGFSQTVIIPSLVITPVMGSVGVIAGQGPANTRLFIEEGDQGANNGYVSTDRTGRFAVAIDQLQNFSGNSALQWGDWARVTYFDSNNNRVSFDLQPPDLGVQKSANGNARPGGVYVYRLNYWNNGNANGETTVITDTLPAHTTYAGDTSGLTHQLGAGGVITWQVGTLATNAQGDFNVTVNVDAGAPVPGTLDPNCVGISTTTPGEVNLGDNQSCSDPVTLEASGAAMVDVGVYQRVNPNDPTPGEMFTYYIGGCNNRSTAAGPVWLTQTLPISTTFVSWAADDTRNPIWTPVVTTGNNIVFKAPGLSGGSCAQVDVTLRLNAAAPLYAILESTATIATAGDADPGNNVQVNTDARVVRPRNDVAVRKYTNGGQLIPDGIIDYGVGYWNQGNTAVRVRVTDTLPAGTSYVYGSAWSNGQQITTPVVVGNQLVWDLDALDVNAGRDFSFKVRLDGLTADTVFTNSVQAGLVGAAENTPWDNVASVVETARAAGPNLRVALSHDQWNWLKNRNLNYQIDFQNVGDVRVEGVWITDTRPAETSFGSGGDCQLNWNGNRVVDSTDTGTVRSWKLDYLDPGESGSFGCRVNLDNVDARPRTYTNQVEIDTPPGDTDPVNNQATDTVVNGEVTKVDLRVGTDHSDLWGDAQPGTQLTVTTAYTEVVVPVGQPGCSTCWSLSENGRDGGPIYAGDRITVTAGNGNMPVIITVPSPFSNAADSRTGRVTGQIDSLDKAVVEVQINERPQPQRAQTDAAGHFAATLADFPRGGQGEVRYPTFIDNAEVAFHQDFRSPDLMFTVNYAHNWVETEYEVGHTLWITVTNSAGVVKATQTGLTGVVPWWCCSTGYSTNMGAWAPGQPDIVPGDFIYGALDNGFTTTVRVGTLNGSLNLGTDSLVLTATVPWFSTLLNGQAWVDNTQEAPNCSFTIAPNGGSHTCSFAPFDLTPLWSVGAQYQEPDGDRVRNVFQAPVARLNIQTWGNNQPGESGNFAINVRDENQGDAPAANTLITSTLKGMTYLGDTSGVPAFVAGQVITWNLGTLAGNTTQQFELFVQVTAAAGENITNTVSTSTSSYDQTDNVSKEASWSATVVANAADITVDPGVWTWEPAPGYDYVYSPNVCNKGSTGTTAVTLTNTLPTGTTLMQWWGQSGGWTEVSRGTNSLVVSRPTIVGWRCDQVYVRVHLSAAAVAGDPLQYQAEVAVSNDTNLTNNQGTINHNVGNPYYDLGVGKNWNWGALVPGGEVRYQLKYHNQGNLPITTTLRLTDTLPPNATFIGAWRYDDQGQHPITPTTVTAGAVVWTVPTLDNGYGNDFEVALRLGSAVASGTVITNCATISAGKPEYNNPYDNQECVVETIRADGPNLRVTVNAEWQNSGNQMQYQLHLENIGTTIVNNVTVTDTYPATFALDNWDSNWGFSATNNDGPNHLLAVMLDAPLNPGQSANVNLYLTVPADPLGTLYTNMAEITTPPDDVNAADNVATTVSGRGSDLSLDMWQTGGSATPRPGALVTYTLHFAGLPSQWGAFDTRITDTLPANLEFVSAQLRKCGLGTFFCDNPPDDPASPVLTWGRGNMYPGGWWNDLLVTLRVADAALNEETLVNQAEFWGSTVDPFPLNNSNTHTLTVSKDFKVFMPLLLR